MKFLATLILLVGGLSFTGNAQAQTPPDSTTHRKIETYQIKQNVVSPTLKVNEKTPTEKKSNDSIPPINPKQAGTKEVPQKATPASK